MISCKETAKILLSDQLETQKWWKRMEIRLHLTMCKYCSRLQLQLVRLRSAARGMGTHDQAVRDFEERLIPQLSGN